MSSEMESLIAARFLIRTRRLLKVSSLYNRSSPFLKHSNAPECDSNGYLSPTEASKSFRAPPNSRVFCSRPLNLNDAQGPTTIDYSSTLQEDEFHRLADATMHDLQEKLEEYCDCIEIDGLDIDYSSDVLTLKLGSLGTYVLNKQTPNRQIWLSSPVSGPSRFDWDRESRGWIYRRTKANLLQLLESELEQLCGKPINLS
eukprot:TRINITY_DN5311_c0_g1_i2.p1 TRINITY_DN5311_c0_g1~~TRINITY_DN5311_c0_g1_i2.p1  ORF type:complete len:200 (+),score=21.10 TRINITY_DN5311_c0_g1_i2:122-721(+)